MTIFRSAAPVQPLTLTVEQAATVLGVARSTAYELVRAGDIDSIRLRRRIVVPVAHLAERLGVTATEIWTVVQHGASWGARGGLAASSVRDEQR